MTYPRRKMSEAAVARRKAVLQVVEGWTLPQLEAVHKRRGAGLFRGPLAVAMLRSEIARRKALQRSGC